MVVVIHRLARREEAVLVQPYLTLPGLPDAVRVRRVPVEFHAVAHQLLGQAADGAVTRRGGGHLHKQLVRVGRVALALVLAFALALALSAFGGPYPVVVLVPPPAPHEQAVPHGVHAVHARRPLREPIKRVPRTRGLQLNDIEPSVFCRGLRDPARITNPRQRFLFCAAEFHQPMLSGWRQPGSGVHPTLIPHCVDGESRTSGLMLLECTYGRVHIACP